MNAPRNNPIDPAALKQRFLDSAKERLKGARGRQYWRSLEELSRDPGFAPMLEQEFPRQSAEWDPLHRRDFLRLMGASLALGGLAACTRQPPEKIVPYVQPPEDMIPGKPLFYATAMPVGGYGLGLIMESNMGRPTKAEGNPDHPSSLGSTDVFGQAGVLQLYDPDRSQTHLNRGRPSNWDTFVAELDEVTKVRDLLSGEGVRIVTETVTSPTLAAQIQALLKRWPKAKWVQYEPANRENVFEGARKAFGEALDPVYRLDKAKITLSLDADFLHVGPGRVRYSRDFAAGRSPTPGHLEMNRLYVVESGATATGATADHRLAVLPVQVELIARSLAREMGIDVAAGDTKEFSAWIDAVAKDLKQHRGQAVVIPGEHATPAVHALAHAINERLDAFGATVDLVAPAEADTALQTPALKALADEMVAGQVAALFILGGNPAYYAPVDFDFAASMQKVPFRVHLGLYADETARLCHWHISEAHFLEAWSDVRCHDGTISIIQPLIIPLYSGKSAHELLAAIGGESAKQGLDILKDRWKTVLTGGDFEKLWRKAVHDGVVTGTASPAKKAVVLAADLGPAPAVPAGFTVAFATDPSTHDGRFTNNGWLQELPRPWTKMVWDNALLIGPKTAWSKGFKTGDVIQLDVGAFAVRAAVFVTAGLAANLGVLHLGYGRSAAGRVGNGAGFNAYAIRGSTGLWSAQAQTSRKLDSYELVTTQEHHEMPLLAENQNTTLSNFDKHPDFVHRHHCRWGTLEEMKKHPDFVQAQNEFETDPATGKAISIYPDYDYSKGNQWGMVLNLGACTGCNACVVACVAENNISVVGKDQVRRGREMQWIRIDRYFSGGDDAPMVNYQPVTCMQCENAPCEMVCPAAATVHSRDGLNQMVYNRCIGTRYCSNNCPYKVRRFNFYKFADHETPSLKLQRNPNVTVRARGVMEKCTFCIQRISAARIAAKKQYRDIDVAGDKLQSACQQACPTKAITFGDINNPNDTVAKLRKSPLNYGIFEELATRPRVTYLARIRNPNPELATATSEQRSS